MAKMTMTKGARRSARHVTPKHVRDLKVRAHRHSRRAEKTALTVFREEYVDGNGGRAARVTSWEVD